ncbi:MAG: gliding motility-associated ABC transporter substrate-binding protein GldG [Chlorobi bacterium]|nr:gliding motility-associated ABC transporter substrate-binding protein GldG [Chlorobiota bacterium]
MNRKKIKHQNIIQLLLAVLIIILLNYISSFIFTRFDLTAEKRFTLAPSTVKLLKNLDDIVLVKVYLEDEDLPMGFNRLRKSTLEMLDEFRVYAGDNVQYEFIDPSDMPDRKARNKFQRQLFEKGVLPTTLKINDGKGGTKQKIIFPGAVVYYREREAIVSLLKDNAGASNENKLNNSVQDLEYSLTNAIRQLISDKQQSIAFIEGQGELDQYQVGDIVKSLEKFYTVDRVRINSQLHSLDDYNVIVIAKPDSMFREKDKFIIDQFIMKGGKALWLIDGVKANMDSLAYTSSTIALINNVNLNDQLFRYGVRINPNLIQDIQCGAIPVNTAIAGEPAKFAPAPWLYFPLIVSNNLHPITKNLDMIKTEFVSVLDTVGDNFDVKKQILLTSSPYSRFVNAPVRISLEMINETPDERYFNKPNLPIAVLLEGTFSSVFENRLTPEITNNKDIGFKAKSKKTKMIVVSDGDIIRNYVRKAGKNYYPLPLGNDKWFRELFYGGNKEFILNSINYLCDDEGFMEVRSRELKLRLLNKSKVMNERVFWQIINTVIPILFVILFGLIVIYLRKRKYSNI